MGAMQSLPDAKTHFTKLNGIRFGASSTSTIHTKRRETIQLKIENCLNKETLEIYHRTDRKTESQCSIRFGQWFRCAIDNFFFFFSVVFRFVCILFFFFFI